MSRLNFAPKLDDIKVTDIKRGLGEFVPKPDKAASFALLKDALKKAGYTLASADITVSGTLIHDDDRWIVEAGLSKQRFALEGADVDKSLKGMDVGTPIEVSGGWQTIDKNSVSGEVIQLRSVKRVSAILINPSTSGRENKHEKAALGDIQVSLGGAGKPSGLYFSSIRTTNPGLTVYRGGAVIPRYFYTRQHLGNLKIDRHAVRVSVSYTPTPTLQLEAEIPYQHSSFDDGSTSGSGSGFGNVTLWAKYRFYRTLETWGDKQAAIRFGIELPTGKQGAPPGASLGMHDFVRQQLSPINGGLAFHSDLSYSQAHGRLIYGGNIESTLRGERNGFRMGHEVRINTDLEYVLLPFKYQSPGHELFVSLETSYNYRNRGRLGGRIVAGSGASEFYAAPGLQFTVTPRFAIEASYQMPVIRNAGPLALRTDKSLLVGIRYLY